MLQVVIETGFLECGWEGVVLTETWDKMRTVPPNPLSKSLLFQFMMTLTELLPAIKQLSPLDKIKLIRLLAEEMESREKIAPLEPDKTYHLPTPYNSFGAGAILMQVIESNEEA
jgi:hypothetical protein